MPNKFCAAALIVLILALCASPRFARAEACRHAPRPRLHVGDAAIVAEGVERLNLRALPALDTGIERVLRAGMTMTVLSGPSCNGNYNWWRVEMDNGQRGWVAEGDWEGYYVIPARDAGRKINPFDQLCPLRVSPQYCYLL